MLLVIVPLHKCSLFVLVIEINPSLRKDTIVSKINRRNNTVTTKTNHQEPSPISYFSFFVCFTCKEFCHTTPQTYTVIWMKCFIYIHSIASNIFVQFNHATSVLKILELIPCITVVIEFCNVQIFPNGTSFVHWWFMVIFLWRVLTNLILLLPYVNLVAINMLSYFLNIYTSQRLLTNNVFLEYATSNQCKSVVFENLITTPLVLTFPVDASKIHG